MFYIIWYILIICKSKPSQVFFIFNLTRLVPARLFKKSLLEPNQAREQQHININVKESRSVPEKQQRSTLQINSSTIVTHKGASLPGLRGARVPVQVIGATTPVLWTQFSRRAWFSMKPPTSKSVQVQEPEELQQLCTD